MKHKVSSPLFKSLIEPLFLHGTIETSQAKAKAIQGLVDKVINLAKDKKRQHLLQSYLTGKDLKKRLVDEIIPKLGNRSSGYTSLLKLGSRLGDQTMMVRMSLIGAERLSVLSPQLSDKGKSVVGKSVTDKQKTGKPKSDSRKQKTDNRKVKKAATRRKK